MNLQLELYEDTLRKQFNKNFLIRVKETKEKKSKLLGVGSYRNLVGTEKANKQFLRALNSPMQVLTFKTRNRLRVDFVSK